MVTDWHACLGADRFEHLQLMKFVWRQHIHNLAGWNSTYIEDLDLEVPTEYRELLCEDEEG